MKIREISGQFRARGVFTILLLLALASCLCQRTYHFNHLTTAEGLSSSQLNYYTYKDSDGFVWISSTKGLNRFDGQRIGQYHTSDTDSTSLVHEFASQSRFYESEDGGLWFTNNESLTRYDREADVFSHYYFKNLEGEPLSQYYFWIHLDEATGDIWGTADRQLFRTNINNPERSVWIDSVFVSLKDRMFPADDGGQLLFGCGYGEEFLTIRHYRSDTLVGSLMKFPAPSGVKVFDIRYRGGYNCWLATSAGLYQFDFKNEEWMPFGNADVQDMMLGAQEISWVGEEQLLVATKERGLYVVDVERREVVWQLMNLEDKEVVPFKPKVVRATVDAELNLWIYAKDDGIYFTNLNTPKFTPALTQAEDSLSSIYFLHEGTSGTIYAVRPKEVISLKGKKLKRFPLNISGVEFGQALSTFEDALGGLWVGTFSELYRKKPGGNSFDSINILPPLDYPYSPGYNTFYGLDDGDLLIGTNAAGVFRYDIKQDSSWWIRERFTRPRYFYRGHGRDFLVHTYQDSLHMGQLDASGEYYIDTSFATLPFVSMIAKDLPRGGYWVSTFSGLYWLTRKGGGYSIQLDKVLSEDIIINSILLDENGELWMTVAGGIMKYNPDEGVEGITRFQLSDGLQGLDFNETSALLAGNGKLYFGGVNGITIIDPDTDLSTVPPAQPHLTDVMVNEDPKLALAYSTNFTRNTAYIEGLVCPYDMNNITVRYSAMEFSDPASCEYWYQLEGGESTTKISLQNDPLVRLPNLAIGAYQLKLWSANSDGEISEEPIVFSITILPPWYRTWWFYTLVFFAISCLMVVFLWDQYRKLRKVELAQLSSANSRREATERELAMLRLQMDPHFVSNSLVSVQEFLQIGDPDEAEAYLVLFSQLIREVLERSVHPLTRLEEALDWLRRYVALEEKRLDAPLRFIVEREEAIDAYATWIPTMILQPFVENAILHGIGNRASGGTVTVRYHHQPEGRGVVLEVEDDGRGRGSRVGDEEHTSMATAITQRRLRLLGAENNASLTHTAPAAAPPNASMDIVDLTDEAGKPKGTRVVINLPWLKGSDG